MTSIPQPYDDQISEFEGRDFCAFGRRYNISCVPVDEDEDDLFNNFHRALHDNLLPLVPEDFKSMSPTVLDCGYGTGLWIDDLLESEWFSDFDEEKEIFGIDIYDRQRVGVQEFQKVRGNLNAPLDLATSTFDLVNHRFLVDGINIPRWDTLIVEYRELLKPGGWLQMVEVQWTFQSQSNIELPALKVWSDTYFEALRIMQKKPLVARDLERRVRFAGFERFRTTVHQIPIGEWRPDDDNEGSAGDVFLYVQGILKSFALDPFIRVLKRSRRQCMDVVQAAQAELRIPGANITFELTVVCGRRPGG